MNAQSSFIQNVRSLIHMHASGKLGGEVMPEDALHGIVPAAEFANVLTLGMSLNYQRNSYSLWQSIAQAYSDEPSRWVFQPLLVLEHDPEVLRHVLLSHRIALQPNRHPEIWGRVAKGIARSSQAGDVWGMIKSAEYDIAIVKKLVQETRKSEFPYLSGPKIFNYWLYVMESYAGVKWKSRELITIAPDTHILKASVELGLCPPDVLKGSEVDRNTVARAWEAALLGSEFEPIDVHTPLWLWSRAGFPPIKHTP